jgi:ribosomal protein S17
LLPVKECRPFSKSKTWILVEGADAASVKEVNITEESE